MKLTLEQLTKDLTNVDLDDILSCWQWRLSDMQAVATISVLGDIFLVDKTVLFIGFKLTLVT